MPMESWAFRSIACLAFVVLLGSPLAGAGSAREEQAMARRVSAELKGALSLELKPASELNALIMQERFAEFEELSKAYEEKFKTDPKYESALVKLYGSMNVRSDWLLDKLDKWVATRPSYISYGARGLYRESRGFKERGTKFSKDTSDEQIARMREFHREAIPDLLAAIKENRRFAPAYVALIHISRAGGDTMSAERALNEAVRWIPESYYVRHAYMTALNPKWGGDYSMMQAYANSLDQAARLNPRIWSLRAEVPAQLGLSAWNSRDYPEAIKYYTEALRYGDRLEFLKNRGSIYLTLKQYAAARRDFARYLEYSRSDDDVNRWINALDAMK